MKKFHCDIAIAAGLALGLGMSVIGTLHAQDNRAKQLNPGVDSQNGTINSGAAVQSPSGTPPGVNTQSGSGTDVQNRAKPVDTTSQSGAPIPDPNQANKALSPGTDQPSSGQFSGPVVPPPAAQPVPVDDPRAGGDPKRASMAAGGKNEADAPAGAAGARGAQDEQLQGAQQQARPGGQPGAVEAQPPAVGPTVGPIGSTGQTMPSKFSPRNDAMDKLPIMAEPMQMSDELKRSIVAAAKADQRSAVDFEGKPASKIPDQVAFDGLSDLPASVTTQAPIMAGYKYFKAKDKILLVNPRERVVIAEIAAY